MSFKRFNNTLVLTGQTDSVSITTGALQISNGGGLAVSGNVSLGSTAKFFGTNTNYTALKSINAANNITLTLPGSLPTSSGSYLVSDTSGNFSFSAGITSASTSFVGTQNVGPVNITGLVFSTGSFEVNVTVNIIATTNLTEIFKLSGILSAGPSGWNLTTIALSGDLTNVNFSITTTGQIQYTSPSFPGFTSLTFLWSNYISSSSIVNLSSGINTTVEIVPNFGLFFNVNSATSTDTITATSGTLNVFNGVYIGQPTLIASNTGVTTTTASTVFIDGEPIAGANETFTNTYALKVKGKIGLDGSSSGTVSIVVPATVTNYSFNLPSSNGTIGQSLLSGGTGSPNTWGYSLPTSTVPGTFTGANNTGPNNITGLLYNGGVDDFMIHLKVTIVATTNLKEYFIVYGLLSNNSSTGWSLTSTSVAGDTTGVNITIAGTGQLQYTCPNISGFTSLTFNWK